MQGFIRFAENDSAQRAIDALKEKNDGKFIINDTELEVRVLEGKASLTFELNLSVVQYGE